MTDMTDVFNEARDILRESGWTQGTVCDSEGRRCALGALYGTSFFASRSSHASGIIMAARRCMVDYAYDHGYLNVPEWNDAPERTYEDVMMMFKELAAGAGEA